MPVKLLGTVVLLIIVTIFCGFNLGEAYQCNINLLFHTFEHVPVFFTVLISFFCGVLIMIPFTVGNAKYKAAAKEAEAKARQEKAEAKAKQKADVQAKKEAELAARKQQEQARLAQKERKAKEKAAKKNSAAPTAVSAANEVPVIKTTTETKTE